MTAKRLILGILVVTILVGVAIWYPRYFAKTVEDEQAKRSSDGELVQREDAEAAARSAMSGYGWSLPEGDYSTDFLQAIRDLCAAGTAPSPALIHEILGGLVTKDKQAEFVRAYMEVRMRPAIISRFGFIGRDEGVSQEVLRMGMY